MTIAEIILLITLIVVSIIHLLLYRKYVELLEWEAFSIAFIHDLLTGKFIIQRPMSEKEFQQFIEGGKKNL